MIVDSNPYTPPEVTSDSPDPTSAFDRRFVFLLLPPLIPLIVHSVVRVFIPAEDTVDHAMFTLGAIIPAWIWSQTMIDRLRLPFWKSYVVACCVWGAVLVSSLMSPTILNWAVSRLEPVRITR